ncbi:hypothetical protein ANCCEY_04702 [Ancylostoma ceylanicum]|uniref:Uncharacterized protein n=1 Tax=Ancylostoma ceylanicum TaxID=53326 RepID=A0A0D6LWK7_9BILA|nr:hypothetical protein ANCCEY_04702 [Ancylostoma ceylanicum]
MERLKKGIAPLQVRILFMLTFADIVHATFQFASIRVTTSSLEGVNLEADLYSKKVMKQVIKILESLTVKVSGFSDPVRVRASEAKSDFPRYALKRLLVDDKLNGKEFLPKDGE